MATTTSEDLTFKNPVLILIIISTFPSIVNAFRIYKTTIDTSGSETVNNVTFGEKCPVSLDLDTNNPSYTVQIQHSCSDVDPVSCSVDFHIQDQLLASVFEICGDLTDIDVGECSLKTLVRLDSPFYGTLLRVSCPSHRRLLACSKNSIELHYVGLAPYANFGKALFFMTPISMNQIYYMDSYASCSSQRAQQVQKGTIMSQHSLSASDDLPPTCILFFSALNSQLNMLCVTFSYAKFSCSSTLTVKESKTSTIMQKYDCRHLPVLSKEECFQGNGQRHFVFHLFRPDKLANQGFALYFEFITKTTEKTTFEPISVSTSAESVPTAEDNTSPKAQTIAIFVSVLVAVSLVIIIVWILKSKYRPCRRGDDLQDIPEQGAVTGEETWLTPTAPLASNTQDQLSPLENIQFQPGNHNTGDEMGTTRNQPPPAYDSLFTNT